MTKTKHSLLVLFTLVISASMLGCGSGVSVESKVAELNKTNVSRVASCYAMYQMRNGYKGPKNIDQLKEFLTSPTYTAALDMMGVDQNDLDSLFISERDDSEIKIRPNVKGSARGCYEPVSFETVGVDGARLIGFANGTFEEVSDTDQYDDYFNGKWKPEERTDEAIPKFDNSGKPIN